MFEHYTEPARRVIFFARYEAAQTNSPFIETEHVLLGVIRQDGAMLVHLIGADAAVDQLQAEISSPEVRSGVSTSVDLPLSSQSMQVLAYAAEEAERLQHRRIGIEHLLLGLMRVEDGRAAEVLGAHGLTLGQARKNLTEKGDPSS